MKRKILAESLLKDETINDLPDYKIHCFNNGRMLILVCRDRFNESGLTEDFYDENWNHINVRRPKHPNASTPSQRPEMLEEMLKLADILSRGCPFLRVDFYCVNHKIYFGELTFSPAGACTPFKPRSVDYEWGSWITLPEKTNC